MIDGVTLTGRAAARITKIVATEPEAKVLRLSVEGGGCSGFSYKFDLVPGPESDDVLVSRDGAILAVDAMSVPLVAGSEVDFIDDLMGQSFQVKNPNATASCGCGTSFAI